MKESQNIEFKSIWKDEFLKVLCGFDNSNGGFLRVGVNNKGEAIGVSNAHVLLEKLPIKIKDNLGIVCSIDLKKENHLEVIEIKVKRSPHPVSFNGKYYLRSGSVTNELSGSILNDFVQRNVNSSWEEIEEPLYDLSDIDDEAVAQFVKDANVAGRIQNAEKLTKTELLQKLGFYKKKVLNRAALVLLGQNPHFHLPSCTVKIGKFGSNSHELLNQDVIEGNLIHNLYTSLEILEKKYLIKNISFIGVNRIEELEYPYVALREIVLNALVHRNYERGAILISIYPNKITFWNYGDLPAGIDFLDLFESHPSIPRNQLIANACFKAGYIESWGTGFLKIVNACMSANLPAPTVEAKNGGILITILKGAIVEKSLNLDNLELNERQKNAIKYLMENPKITNSEYQAINNTSERTASRDLKDLAEKDIIEYSGKDGAGSYYILNKNNDAIMTP